MEQISVMSTVSGLFIGTLVLCANFQFGLQTGWVSMMSMPAALLGYAWFKAISKALSPQENVYIQSVAVAVGTGPLSFGLVGAIPAIQILISEEEGRTALSLLQLIVWSAGIAFIGIFTAVLLRDMIISNKQLRFPSGSAAAALIGVLHDKPVSTGTGLDEADTSMMVSNSDGRNRTYRRNIIALVSMFGFSSIYTGLTKFVPFLQEIPIFGKAAAVYMWTFQLSPAYVGQGIIMGLPTTAAMMFGAVVGWAVLVPLADKMNWAPGPIDDWQNGAQGWIMWVSLAIMVADTGVSFLILVGGIAADSIKKMKRWRYKKLASTSHSSPPSEQPDTVDEGGQDTGAPSSTSQQPQQADRTTFTALPAKNIERPQDQHKVAIWGLLVSALLCIACVKLLFGTVPIVALTVAVVLSPFLSLLGIRALGETDLNPVSSIAKLTQFFFGLMMRNRPHAVLLNIVAGAITEAGAQQAGDLMQDYKTGGLLGASMTSQTVGMMIGTLWSVIASAFAYRLYTTRFEIPGKEYRIPTAYIWADCARLMTGEGLPARTATFALALGGIFAVLSVVKHFYAEREWCKWVPSGVAVGIGMYNVPSFTIARFIGGIVAFFYSRRHKNPADEVYTVILSSGLILGEGIVSVLWLLVQ